MHLSIPRVDLLAGGSLDPHHWPPGKQPSAWRLHLAPVLSVPLLLWASHMLTWFFFWSLCIKIYFSLQKQLGYAKSIPSVSSSLLNSNVHKTKNNCTEREFWEMQRILSPSLSFWSQILTFPKCLKRKETNSLGGNFFVTLLKTKIQIFFFFCVVFLLYFPSCCIGIVKYVVHSENQGKSCVTCSSFADLLVLPMLRLDACLVWDAVGPSGLRVQGAFPLPGSCHHGVVMCCAFLCFTPSCCWWPCKVAFGKDQRAEATQEGKGNSGAGSQPGQGLCWPQGWPRGAPHSQDSNFPALETCCAVYFDSLCVQMYVFTIVSGRGECLTLVFETELYFCL